MNNNIQGELYLAQAFLETAGAHSLIGEITKNFNGVIPSSLEIKFPTGDGDTPNLLITQSHSFAMICADVVWLMQNNIDVSIEQYDPSKVNKKGLK